MKKPFAKLTMTACLVLLSTGCIVNPTPNAGHFSMSDAETKASLYNSQQTFNTDRENRKAILRDEAEVRAWESNISRPNNIIVVPRR